ncbi:MAG: glycine zipper 2TM domain-containing protein [Sulfuricella sp.]
MKTTKLVLAGLAAALALASGAALAEQYSDRARVVSATPEYDRVNVPRQECYDEYQAAQPYGERSYGGSVIGGITGALVGNQIGRGHGREAATALGAITGAIVGDRLQNQNIDDNRGPRSVRRCREIDSWENRLAGYRVVYEYSGHRYATMMPNDPGSYVRVRVSVDAYED